MSRSVRVYIEGGATGRIADSTFRYGWKRFLNELHVLARENGYHSLEVVRGKGRARTFDRFTKYNKRFPQDLCVLLVDAETAVPKGARIWDIVANRKGDNWKRPPWATEKHLFLMVHFVETWLLTDQNALQQFFKRGLDLKPLPTTNLEARSKQEIEAALKKATQLSSKGAYKHGQAHEIIGTVAPERVKTLTHGQRLFSCLSSLIRGNSNPNEC